MNLNIINKEGEQLYIDGKPYINPYPLNSLEFNEFERGWTQAFKRGSINLGPITPSKPATEMELNNTAINSLKYRNLKG